MSSSTSSTSIGTITVPLTTFFTPAAWCNNQPYTYQKKVSGVSQFIRDADGPGDGRKSSCYPQDFGVFKTGISLGIYSPAVCPSGWSATTIPHSLLSPTVSWSMCCPTGFTASLYDGDGWSCQSTVQTPTTALLDDGSPISITGKALMADWPIFIAWESTDFNKFTPKAAPLLTAAPSAATSSSAFTPSKTSTPTPTRSQNVAQGSKQKSEGGLPLGTEAGIGVGAAVVGLAALAFIVFYLMRRRKRHQNETTPYSMTNVEYKQAPSELDGFVIHEAHGATRPAELHRSPIVAELSADWHH